MFESTNVACTTIDTITWGSTVETIEPAIGVTTLPVENFATDFSDYAAVQLQDLPADSTFEVVFCSATSNIDMVPLTYLCITHTTTFIDGLTHV